MSDQTIIDSWFEENISWIGEKVGYVREQTNRVIEVAGAIIGVGGIIKDVVIVGFRGYWMGIKVVGEYTKVVVLEVVDFIKKGQQLFIRLLTPVTTDTGFGNMDGNSTADSSSTGTEGSAGSAGSTNQQPPPKPPPKATHFSEPSDEYGWDGKTKTRIGHGQIDELIEAYEHLYVDIVKVILDKQQLVDFPFIKRRYKKLQILFHPDKSTGSHEKSVEINLANEKVKDLYHDSQIQFEMIVRILSHFGKTKMGGASYTGDSSSSSSDSSSSPGTSYNLGASYTLLFVVAAAATGIIVSMKKS